MTLRNAVLTALIATAGACDAPVPPAATFRLFPSGYWSDGDGGCDGIYIKSEYGAICLPVATDDACDAPQINECGQPTTKVASVDDGGTCILACEFDWQCHGGQACDPDMGMCVWQNMPAEKPNAFAPCETSDDCDGDMFCATRESADGTVTGSFCTAPCGECYAADVLYCKDRMSTTVPVCDDAGACIAPCSEDQQCLGGSVCIAGACAWPLP